MSERINCGNQRLENNGMECYVCDLLEGHCGFHRQRDQAGTVRVWADSERAELCGAHKTSNGRDYWCHKERGHNGQHEATVRVESHPIAITTFVWGDSDPAPTAFDKAWEKEGDNFMGACYLHYPKPVYRAGWQARGKAVNSELQACDTRRELGRDGSDDKYLGYSRGICQAISINQNLDAGDERK